MQDSREWNGIKLKWEDWNKRITEQKIRKTYGLSLFIFFLSLAFWNTLVCHRPPLYGSLYGHVQVWNSICCADMARAGWITGVCGYTNSTYLPFNYWLLLFVKNSFNQMAVKHSNVITFYYHACLYIQFVKGSPLSWVFFFLTLIIISNKVNLAMGIHFICNSTFCYLDYPNHVHVSPNAGRQRHRSLYRDHRDIC